MKKKILALTLSCIMILSMVGCGQTSEESKPLSSAGNEATKEVTEVVNEEPTKLVVEVFDRGNMTDEYGDCTDNVWTQWIKERALEELNIEVEFLPIVRSEETTKLTALISAEQEPDIMYTYSPTYLYGLVDDGALADMTESIDKYGSNIKALFSEEHLAYGQVKGGQYALNGLRATTSMLSSFVRKDWLDAVGVEVQERNGMASMTPSELMDAMVKIKEAGLCEYPMTVLPEFQSLVPVEGAFISKDQITDEMRAKTKDYSNLFAWEGSKDAYAFLNECFNKELINPDFALYSRVEEEQWIASGQTAYWSAVSWQSMAPGEHIDALYEANPEAEVIAIDLCTEEGESGSYYTYAPIGAYIMVSENCENVDAAVRYLDWLCSEEAHMMLGHGVEGEHWQYTAEGFVEPIDAEYNNKTRISVSDLNLIGLDPCQLDPEVRAYAATKAVSEKVVDLYVNSYAYAVNGKWAPVSVGRVIDAEVEYGEDLAEYAMDLIVNSIMAKPGKFDSVYDAAYQAYLDNGGQQVMDERLAAYRENN